MLNTFGLTGEDLDCHSTVYRYIAEASEKEIFEKGTYEKVFKLQLEVARF